MQSLRKPWTETENNREKLRKPEKNRGKLRNLGLVSKMGTFSSPEFRVILVPLCRRDDLCKTLENLKTTEKNWENPRKPGKVEKKWGNLKNLGLVSKIWTFLGPNWYFGPIWDQVQNSFFDKSAQMRHFLTHIRKCNIFLREKFVERAQNHINMGVIRAFFPNDCFLLPGAAKLASKK